MPGRVTGKWICRAALCLACPLFLEARMHTVGGCVKGPGGRPAAGAVVFLEEADGSPKLMTAAGPDGCYKKTEVPDGFYEVRAEWNGVVLARRNLTLEHGFSATVDLEYAPKPPARAPMIDLKMLSDTFKATPKEAASLMIQSLAFTLKVIDAGDPTMGTIRLARPAPAGGRPISLAVSHPALVVMPEQVTVPEGETSISFPVSTRLVRGPSDVVLRFKASDLDGSRTVLLTVRSHTRVTLRIQGSGKWRVISVPPGMSCDSDVCTAPFAEGVRVQLAAEAQPGTVFQGWSGDCSAEGDVVVSGPMQCVARFDAQTGPHP